MNLNPFRELEEVSNRLNRLFWRPSVDISETDAAYLVKAEIPGVKKG